MRKTAFILLLLASPSTARAQGLDLDPLLTDAPATPPASTVRIAGFGATTVDQDANGTGRVFGNVMWAVFEHFAIDGGAYWQSGQGAGPALRARYQFLSQAESGVDLAAGVRFKMVGFHPDRSEIEALIAVGRRFGDFDLVLNGVVGFETEGQGKDVEVKSFAGWHIGETFRAGIDGRLAAEVEDEEAEMGPKIGREFELLVGPAVSVLPVESVAVQALVGLSLPRKSDAVAVAGILGASVEF